MYLNIQAIVLRVTDYNDRDALLTVLSRNHGKLTLKARGLRRKNSPLIAPCQLLAFGEFTIFEYRGQYTINEAHSIELFTPLRRDLTKLALGTYFAQVAEIISQEDLPNPELQSLVLNSLFALSKLNLPEPLVKSVFELRAACLAGYTPDLVELSTSISTSGQKVDRSCYDALLQMIADCNKECPKVCVVSSYRTHEYQEGLFQKKVNFYLNQGYGQEEAVKLAGTVVAVPGTSEHQLGLAVDIIDTRSWNLNEGQADLPAQQWLMENSWKYGFILRYPKDTTDSTGIIYEPWHYRYVGKEVAKEIHDLGITLEEYITSLTK